MVYLSGSMPKPTPVHCPICGKENDFFAEPMIENLELWLGTGAVVRVVRNTRL